MPVLQKPLGKDCTGKSPSEENSRKENVKSYSLNEGLNIAVSDHRCGSRIWKPQEQQALQEVPSSWI